MKRFFSLWLVFCAVVGAAFADDPDYLIRGLTANQVEKLFGKPSEVKKFGDVDQLAYSNDPIRVFLRAGKVVGWAGKSPKVADYSAIVAGQKVVNWDCLPVDMTIPDPPVQQWEFVPSYPWHGHGHRRRDDDRETRQSAPAPSGFATRRGPDMELSTGIVDMRKKTVFVRDYERADGTEVESHFRRPPRSR